MHLIMGFHDLGEASVAVGDTEVRAVQMALPCGSNQRPTTSVSFSGEASVPPQPEGADAVGRQAMGVPDALDGGRADPLVNHHGAAAPPGRPGRRGWSGVG